MLQHNGDIRKEGQQFHHCITQWEIPPLLECKMMPDDRSEIHTPDIAQHFPHLTPVADKIPPPDPSAPILLLLGRDILSVHKVRKQYNGPHNTPYAQRLDIGWVRPSWVRSALEELTSQPT